MKFGGVVNTGRYQNVEFSKVLKMREGAADVQKGGVLKLIYYWEF